MRVLRRARPLVQILLLGIAVLLVVHGLFGPQLAPRNLATVLTWVHYRGLLIGALLAFGNVFCFGCPMVLARDTVRRVVHPAWRWPRVLRTKWIAVALFAAVLFGYELFDWWALPQATAALIVGYFVAAIVVDGLFAGASFCKYVCPLGQFNFMASTLSPTELKVRSLTTCQSCRTVDCIKGRRDPVAPMRVVQRGCELALFQPAKIGNLDCTLCLDCVAACPHDNVALSWRTPGEELLDGRRRSGIGVLARRRDLAALAVVFTCAALLNAFAMTRPVYAVEQQLAGLMRVRSEWPVLAVLFVAALVAIPLVLLAAAAATSRLVTRQHCFPQNGFGPTVAARMTSYAYALLPFGAAMWLSHYGFHLLTGALTVVPVTQAAARDVAGGPVLGDPLWQWVGLSPGSVFPFQLGCLILGAIGSIAFAYRLALRDEPRRPAIAALPWALVILLFAAAAAWILWQPMEMRGTALGG